MFDSGLLSAMRQTAAPLGNHLGFWAFTLLALAGAASCGSSDTPAGAGEAGKASGATCPSGNTLTYDSFGRNFMQTYCTRCHSTALTGAARQGAPDDHNFDTLAGILDMPDHIDHEAAAGPAAVNTAMPPDGAKPSAAERQQLGQWLACETGGGDDGGGQHE
jgi:uncharacterized membrane protein